MASTVRLYSTIRLQGACDGAERFSALSAIPVITIDDIARNTCECGSSEWSWPKGELASAAPIRHLVAVIKEPVAVDNLIIPVQSDAGRAGVIDRVVVCSRARRLRCGGPAGEIYRSEASGRLWAILWSGQPVRSEEHTSELQSRFDLV